MIVKAQMKDEEFTGIKTIAWLSGLLKPEHELVIKLRNEGFAFGDTLGTGHIPKYPISTHRDDANAITYYEQEIPDDC